MFVALIVELEWISLRHFASFEALFFLEMVQFLRDRVNGLLVFHSLSFHYFCFLLYFRSQLLRPLYLRVVELLRILRIITLYLLP